MGKKKEDRDKENAGRIEVLQPRCQLYSEVLYPLKQYHLYLLIFMGKNILLLMALIVGAMTACSGSNSLSGLATGTVDFQGSSGSPNALTTSTFTHTFPTPFVQTPAVAFGLWNANFAASSATQFSQFSIQVAEAQPSNVRFTFSRKSGLWTSIKIGFWATIRPDFTLGTASADFGSFRSSNTAYNVVTTPIMNYQKAIIRTFINGFALNPTSQGIQIQIDGKAVQPNTVTIAIASGPQTDLKKIYFSYIAFSPSTTDFASYGGVIIEQGFSGTGYKDIRNLIHFPKYILQGFNKVSSPLKMDFSTSIDTDFIYTYNTKNAFDFAFTYILIGPRSQGVCANCLEKFALDEDCVSTCPAGTYPNSYKQGGSACTRCSSKLNLAVNAQRNACGCAAGFQNQGGVCKRVQLAFDALPEGTSFGSFGTNIIPATPAPSVTTPPPTTTTTSAKTTTTTTTTAPPVIPATLPTSVPVTVPAPTNTNSYPINTPTQVVIPQVQPIQPSQPTPTPVGPTIPNDAINAKSCIEFPNSYWTGYRCACRVGYRQNPLNGQCQRIGLVIQNNTVAVPNIPNPANCGANANYNGITCVCNTGYVRNANQECVYELRCPENSYKLGEACICNPGYIRQGDLCAKTTEPQCGGNSFRNSLGVCVCNTGYIRSPQGTCELDNRCPSNEVVSGTGTCVCIAGFFRNSQGQCVRCENGAVHNGTTCVFACGIQEVYNQALQRCECRQGYGKYNGICQICPADFFLKNGFCVTCPINALYDGQGGCVCKEGFSLFNSICVSTCEGNKVFSNGKCICREGLGFINANTCGICPQGQVPNSITQVCGACPANQVLSGNRCICAQGFGFLTPTVCGVCEDNGKYLLGGFCVTCPPTYRWNGQICACPLGSIQQNGRCVEQCSAGQLVDPSGYCYTCPVNELISNGQCVCRPGYTRNAGSGFCTLSCDANQRLINGRCASCVLNTVYSETLKACVCPPGSFTNTAGICEIFAPPPATCQDGQYYSSTTGCLPCPAGCKSCESAQKCTSCIQAAFVPNGAICIRPCGNGVLDGTEQCDDKNVVDRDGCSSTCTVEFGWTCRGTPSACVPTPQSICGNRILEDTETCDDGNTANLDGCSNQCRIETGYICDRPTSTTPSVCRRATSGMRLDSPIVLNNGAVYGTVLLDTAFTFASQTEMQNFMKYNYNPNAVPTANYCNQRIGDLTRFDCLFLYPYGVPLFKFEIGLSYQKDGKSGQLSIPVDATTGQLQTRSLT